MCHICIFCITVIYILCDILYIIILWTQEDTPRCSQDDCDEMLGYMLPALCPLLCFTGHWMLHKYRRQRCSAELELALKQLRGLLAWENQKFNGIRLLLRSECVEPPLKELEAHIEVTLWLNGRCLVEPSDVFGDVSLIPEDTKSLKSALSRENDFFDITDSSGGLEDNCTVKI